MFFFYYPELWENESNRFESCLITTNSVYFSYTMFHIDSHFNFIEWHFNMWPLKHNLPDTKMVMFAPSIKCWPYAYASWALKFVAKSNDLQPKKNIIWQSSIREVWPTVFLLQITRILLKFLCTFQFGLANWLISQSFIS